MTAEFHSGPDEVSRNLGSLDHITFCKSETRCKVLWLEGMLRKDCGLLLQPYFVELFITSMFTASPTKCGEASQVVLVVNTVIMRQKPNTLLDTGHALKCLLLSFTLLWPFPTAFTWSFMLRGS